MIDEARAEAENIRKQAATQLSEERAAAAEELFSRTIELAVHLAELLLRELAIPSIEHAFLNRVLDYLDRLSAQERAALISHLGETALVVTTAHPLDAREEAQWREQLGKRIGAAGGHKVQQRSGAYRRRRNHVAGRSSSLQLARRADHRRQGDQSQ